MEGMRVVTSGLMAGELVVVDGLQRVRPGAPVTPQKVETDERGMPIDPPPAGGPPGAGQTPAAKAPAAASAASAGSAASAKN
jgi:multidrug efflux system membrane fusion protein